MRPVAAAAAILSVCLLGGITTYAAIKYLTPSEIASEVFENGYLAEAFEEANAIQINEQMAGDGYLFTLLGITSGKGLNGYLDADEEKLLESESYAVLAIEKLDGTPMPAISDAEYDLGKFLISPLLGDQNPWEVNIYSLDGFATEFVKDGITYRIISCKDLNMFADRGVYLAICHNLSGLREGYLVDKDKCTISRNADYDELNVLFKLPLDVKEADHEEATQILDEILNPKVDESSDNDEEFVGTLSTPQNLEEWMKLLDMGMPSNDIIRRCHIVSGTEQTVSADETGGYKYYLEEDMLSSYIDAAFIDKSGDWQITGYGCDDTLDSLEISMYRYNADGTVTFALFTPNEE